MGVLPLSHTHTGEPRCLRITDRRGSSSDDTDHND